MTRTKTNKLVAILMAIFMAFAFMSFSLTYVSAAEGDDSTPASQSEQKEESDKKNESPTTDKTAPQPTYSLTKYEYGAPDIEVNIDFGTDLTPVIDFSKTTDQDVLNKIINNVKVYTDKSHTREIKYSGAKITGLKFTNNKVTFTVPLHNSTGLAASSTYYLWLGPDLNAAKDASGLDVAGYDSDIEFTTNRTTTTSTTRSTTRTTYRTITTRNVTTRAKSANTDDPSHLPLWIGLAAVSALMLGAAVYFSKEKE